MAFGIRPVVCGALCSVLRGRSGFGWRRLEDIEPYTGVGSEYLAARNRGKCLLAER